MGDKTALALTKYNEAIAGTIDKHGKLHASTADHIEATRITYQGLANALDDANGKLQTSSTVTVDNTTKIGSLTGQIDALVQKEKDAKAAVDATTNAFVYSEAIKGMDAR